MTIAEFITLERTDELMGELRETVQQGRFLCDSIEYAVPNQDFYFERVIRIPNWTAIICRRCWAHSMVRERRPQKLRAHLHPCAGLKSRAIGTL